MRSVFDKAHWLRVAESWSMYEGIYPIARRRVWCCLFLAYSGLGLDWDDEF